MEQITDSIFSSLTLPENSQIILNDKILFVTKWNWDFKDCEQFQLQALDLVSKNRDHKIYIFCNHPHCFTLGKGNERGEDLVDFDPKIIEYLKYPVHQIHRGGGITFHYPGQWIFYPICAVNEKYNLDDHMCWLLTTVKNVLKDSFGIHNALSAKKLMGIWVERNKIASIGVGLKKFVTIHGLALNLVYDELMFDDLKKINPCGMSPETYVCLNQKCEINPNNLVESFHKIYINSIKLN